MTTAAVLESPRKPLALTDIDVEPPRAGEVMVEVGASGVCHSDISVWNETLAHPVPLVLGHEAAGTVTGVGAGVTSVAPGDRVVLSWLAQCGTCFYCTARQPQLCEVAGVAFARGTLLDGTTRYRRDGQPGYQMAGLGTFTGLAMDGLEFVYQRAAAPQVPDVYVRGSAWSTAFKQYLQNKSLGDQAYGYKISTNGSPVAGPAANPQQVLALTGGRGADHVLEVVGRQQTVRDAIRMTRRGGQVVLVGAAGDDVTVTLPAFSGVVMTEKVIRGSLYGSSDVRRDVPRLVSLYQSGLLKLDEMVTETFPFAQVNEAVEYCAAEKGARAVVMMS